MSPSNLDETYTEQSVAYTDDLVRFWRSKVEVTAGRRGGEGIHVNATKSIFLFLTPGIFTTWGKKNNNNNKTDKYTKLASTPSVRLP